MGLPPKRLNTKWRFPCQRHNETPLNKKDADLNPRPFYTKQRRHMTNISEKRSEQLVYIIHIFTEGSTFMGLTLYLKDNNSFTVCQT